LRGCSVDITDYVVQMGSDGMIYIPSFMKIGAILRFYLRNFIGFNAGISVGRSL
jgi:hypothetical protein